jgi:hypothetical protein
MTIAFILRTNETQEYIVDKMPGYCIITSAVLEAELLFLNATLSHCMDLRLFKGKVNSSRKSK